MAYRINMIYPDGDTEIQDEVYDTYEDADEAAQYLCSCFSQGGEVLALAGEDFIEGDADYEIFDDEEE